MKKIVKLSLIALIIIAIVSCCQNIYAASSCKISIETDKSHYTKGDEIIAYIKLSNIQSTTGIISVGLTLEYDKDSLEIVEMEGQNGWDSPIEGVSYNAQNGLMVLTKGGLAKNDENITKITFKVKENSKSNVTIELKDISASDSTLIKADNFAKNITIGDESTSNPSTSEPSTSNPSTSNPSTSNPSTNNPSTSNPSTSNPSNSNPSTGNQSTNNSSNGSSTQNNQSSNNKKTTVDKSVANGVIPKTGKANIIGISFISVLIIGLIIFYIIRRSSNKARRYY